MNLEKICEVAPNTDATFNMGMYKHMCEVALVSAKEAGRVLIRYFRKGVPVKYKTARNPVTIADHLSQKRIVRLIKRSFPDHKTICEESSDECATKPSHGESEYSWVIDPLDGTVNFIHGLAQFCVSIGVLHRDEPVVGVIYNPVTNELFSAVKGVGTYRNGRRVYVSSTATLNKSLLVTGFPYYVVGKSRRVMRNMNRFIVRTEGVRRLGSAALDMAYVACGTFDGFWEEGLNPWDVAAGTIIVSEAGGKVTDYSGKNKFMFGREMVASNGKIHNAIVRVLNS
ncbi:MAG: inositol monophosphatase [Elusimicrobia bacterium]|nr:inositol monophosphatase [Elusimicrobiota bacterium]